MKVSHLAIIDENGGGHLRSAVALAGDRGHQALQSSPPFHESDLGCSRLCGVCSWQWQWDPGSGFEAVVPGQSPPATGSCRFERPIDASVLALGLKSGPEHRVRLESNERNFLFLMSWPASSFRWWME